MNSNIILDLYKQELRPLYFGNGEKWAYENYKNFIPGDDASSRTLGFLYVGASQGVCMEFASA